MKPDTYASAAERREHRETQRLRSKIRFRHMSIDRYATEIVELEAELERRTRARSCVEALAEGRQNASEVA